MVVCGGDEKSQAKGVALRTTVGLPSASCCVPCAPSPHPSHPSSIPTDLNPASHRLGPGLPGLPGTPVFATIASMFCRIRPSSMSAKKAFQERQAIGGVAASPCRAGAPARRQRVSQASSAAATIAGGGGGERGGLGQRERVAAHIPAGREVAVVAGPERAG